MDGNHQHIGPEGEIDPQEIKSTLGQRVQHHIGRAIISGLFVLIPLLVTLLFVHFIVTYVDSFVRPLIKRTPYVQDIAYIQDIPGLGLVLTLILFYIVGALVFSKSGKRAVEWQNSVLGKIPIIGTIYGFAEQGAGALATGTSGKHFKRVVFLEWPNKGFSAMGFVTGHCHLPGHKNKMMVAVYIPTVPNPTSGMLAFVAENEIIETDITVEEAMKVVFSGGMVLPDSMQRHVPEVMSSLSQSLPERGSPPGGA